MPEASWSKLIRLCAIKKDVKLQKLIVLFYSGGGAELCTWPRSDAYTVRYYQQQHERQHDKNNKNKKFLLSRRAAGSLGGHSRELKEPELQVDG